LGEKKQEWEQKRTSTRVWRKKTALKIEGGERAVGGTKGGLERVKEAASSSGQGGRGEIKKRAHPH